MESISLIILLILLALIVREGRAGNRAIKGDPNVHLNPRERFRTLRMEMLEPVIAVVVVGSLLLTDLGHDPIHALAAAVGAVAGFVFGVYRARSTYVAAIPHHKGVILRFSVESFVALGSLVVIKIVAERNLLPDGDIFRVVLAGLLGFLLVESVARVLTLVRCFRRDEAAAVSFRSRQVRS